MIKVWDQGDVSGNTIPMAGRTLFTEIHGLLRHVPRIRHFLRLVLRFFHTVPAMFARRIFPTSQHRGPASGFYSGAALVLKKSVPGEILLESQTPPFFPQESLIKRSGLGQDGHQPWPVFWMKITHAQLCGRSLVPKDAMARLMADATFSRTGDKTDPAYDHVATGGGKLISGNATSIVSRWGGDAWGNRRYGGAGYWHWLFDSVSRLSLMDRFPADTKVITPPLTPWMRWFLDRLHLENRIIETEATALRVEHFYFSSPSSMSGCWNPYAVDFLRQSFLSCGSPPSDSLPKRFYIIREGYTRGISNEQEVRDYFKSQGWALIAPEKLFIADQIALFRDAEAIAGLHGSALTNLVWCSPGASVIEFTPANFMSGAFEWLSSLNRLHHHFQVCPADTGGNSAVPVGTLHSFFNKE
jgi:capsular polysaccharide biosynthesis protein